MSDPVDDAVTAAEPDQPAAATPAEEPSGVDASGEPIPGPGRQVTLLSPRNIWQVGWVILALLAIASFVGFVIGDGGAVFFTVLMSWFASVAMEPAVRPLSRHMKRGLATGLVMITFLILTVLFVVVFGQLLIDQIAQLVRSLPSLVQGILDKIASITGSKLDLPTLFSQLNISPATIAGYAGNIFSSALGIIGTVLGSVFGVFTFVLFTFYLSADGPRFRRYLVGLFPTRMQKVAADVWDVTSEKTGGYVAARVVLATINSVTTGIVFVIIGMPYWLPLAIWTGLVAQFVPTIGTYISIILPVLVGLLSPTPIIGVIALVWALLYQQVENLTIEPRISARAVDVHPAVAFGSVMLGAALFGAAGALLSIPVIAMVLSLLETYRTRHEVLPELLNPPDPTSGSLIPKPTLPHRKGGTALDETAAATDH
ncbi:MAG: AI-2E family transporter [Candidatus Nanopelagicales bacterium]